VAAGADGEVLLVTGATGVGKSAVGFEVYLGVRRAGHAAAYVDLDQVGRCSFAPGDDPGNHWLKARNLAAIWRAYHAAGARHLRTTCARSPPGRPRRTRRWTAPHLRRTSGIPRPRSGRPDWACGRRGCATSTTKTTSGAG
jgi:hypothetical protein